MVMNKVIKDFNHYLVFLPQGETEYKILNKTNNVIEGTGKVLPTVLFQAEAWDELLDQFYSKVDNNEEATN